MDRSKRKVLTWGLLSACSLNIPLSVHAASFPSKPLKIVVPYGAGGTFDGIARLLGPRMQALLGQPVVIDNVPGAGTTVGAGVVARSDPDGHTLFLGSNSAFTITPHVMSKLPYDPLSSFAAIGMLSSFPNLIVVRPDSPYQTLGDLVAAAKRGENLSYASFGVGTTAQFSGEAIKITAGANITEVPYKNGSACVQAVLAGEVSMAFDTSIGSVPRVKQGQVRALAVTSSARMSQLPDVPSVVELGYPKAEMDAWAGLFVPAATPAASQAKLSQAVQQVLSDSEIQKQFESLGAPIRFLDGEHTMSLLRHEYVRFGKLVEAIRMGAKQV